MGLMEFWKNIKLNEQKREERLIEDNFSVRDCKVKNDDGKEEWCLCIVHGNVPIRRYYKGDEHQSIMDDLQRCRRTALEEYRARR